MSIFRFALSLPALLAAMVDAPENALCSSQLVQYENAHIFANIGDKLACEDDYEPEEHSLEDVCGGLAIWEVEENSIFGFC